jgi:hypothetical protein
VGNLEGYLAVIAQVGGAVDRSHAAAGDRRIYTVGVELRAGFHSVEKTHTGAYSIEQSCLILQKIGTKTVKVS